METWSWPPTVSGLEAWWIAWGVIGVMASAYDIQRAAREVKHHWNSSERAERGIARIGLSGALVLGFATMICLLVGCIVGLLPQSQRLEEGILVGDVLAFCFVLIELSIVVTIAHHHAERWFVSGFVWSWRERTEQDPPAHDRALPTVPVEPVESGRGKE